MNLSLVIEKLGNSERPVTRTQRARLAILVARPELPRSS